MFRIASGKWATKYPSGNLNHAMIKQSTFNSRRSFLGMIDTFVSLGTRAWNAVSVGSKKGFVAGVQEFFSPTDHDMQHIKSNTNMNVGMSAVSLAGQAYQAYKGYQGENQLQTMHDEVTKIEKDLERGVSEIKHKMEEIIKGIQHVDKNINNLREEMNQGFDEMYQGLNEIFVGLEMIHGRFDQQQQMHQDGM